MPWQYAPLSNSHHLLLYLCTHFTKWNMTFLSSLFFTVQCSRQSSKPCSDTFNVNFVYLPTDKMPSTTPDMKAPDDAWFENKDYCKRHCEAKCIAVWKGCSAFSSMLKSNGQCSCYGWKSTPSFSEDSKYLFGYCVPPVSYTHLTLPTKRIV